VFTIGWNAHIETCRMNGINPQAYPADVLARIADHPIHKINALFPWLWTK
jgi:transposase